MLVKLMGSPPIYARGKDYEQICSRLFMATKALGFKKRSKHSFKEFIASQLRKSHYAFKNDDLIKSDEKFIRALFRIGRLVEIKEG